MMKCLLRYMLLTVALVLSGGSASAAAITEAQARAKAQSFLQSRHAVPGGRRLTPARTAGLLGTPAGQSALYVFNIGQADGFVIVSGDDRARPVLGYADSGTFEVGEIPVALREMLAIYARQIDMAAEPAGSAARLQHRTSGAVADVAPLLTTSWDQGAPYNNYCPLQDDNLTLTGCVATAMAQIANYHEHPKSRVPSLAAYVSATFGINVPAWGATTFDWGNMADSYDGTSTDAQRAAVATLMRYCGQAAQMDYGFTRSGTYNGNAYVAFTEKMGYSKSAEFKSAVSYSTDGWENLIYKEVSEGRPVYYSALNGDEGGARCGGHAFVIDGFRADGNYFHVNWGWGGACNGYFNLFALDSNAPETAPTATGWHYQMLAIVGLVPGSESTGALAQDAAGCWLISTANDWKELSVNLDDYNGGSFKLTADMSVTTMVGTEDRPFSGTFDGQGHTINVNIGGDNQDTAPFCVDDASASIRNLKVRSTARSLAYLTVNVSTAGTLKDGLFDAAVAAAGISDKTTVRSLTVTGSLDAYDMAYLKALPSTLANLVILDLSDASLNDNAITRNMFTSSSYKIIKLPESLEQILSYAFQSSSLNSITIPDGVTKMGDRGLQQCGSLKRIFIGNGVTEIPECWAEFCGSLEEVTIGKKVTSIGWRAFPGTNIKHVYNYARTAPRWNDAFYDGINSDAVLHVYSNSVKSYQKAAGWNQFPTIVGDLGIYPTFDITVNVTEMGTFTEALATAMAAAGCEDMHEISKLTVTGSMNGVDDHYIRDAMGSFLETLDLGAVTMQDNMMSDQALRGCAFEELVLPATLGRFRDWLALAYCANLKTLHIPSSLSEIVDNFLYEATSLETVTGGDGIQSSGCRLCFANCPNLKSPVILNHIFFRLPMGTEGAFEVADHVTTIAHDGLAFVTELTSLTLPESVTAISGEVFSGDENLKDIYYYAVELPSTDESAFTNFDCTACTLHVYREMAEVFQGNGLWSKFNIIGDLGTMPNTNPMVEADYTDLRALACALNGNGWRTKWVMGQNVRTASRWRGVTFDAEGYVTDIDLSDNQLSGDVSEFAFTGMTRLKSLNLSKNALTGDIAKLAASLPDGCTFNVERQNLGHIGDATLYKVCRYGGLPNIAYWQSGGTLASTLIGVGGHCQFFHESTDGGQNWSCDINADGNTWGINKFYWPSPTIVECQYPHRFTFTYTYEMGDANMDDVLNVLDLQATLNYSHNQGEGLFNFYAADTYGADNELNVQDIVTTVNILLERGAGSRAAARALADGGRPAESEACVSVEDGQIVLYTARPVAALELSLSGVTPGQLVWNTEAMGFATATAAQAGSTRAVVYSLLPRVISEGRTVLATFDPSLIPSVAEAVLSDSKAQPVSVGQGVPTGIRELGSEASRSQAKLYDLQGRPVSGGQAKGVYIVNGKKVVVK